MVKRDAENNKEVLMIMLPYAGGSAQTYYNLGKKLNEPGRVLIKAIDYSGHASRFRSKLAKDFDDLKEDAKIQIMEILKKQIDMNPSVSVIIFGHSMGGLVTSYILKDLYEAYPENIKAAVISACLPPESIGKRIKMTYTEKELKEYLCNVRNISADIVNEQEFTEFILPYVKNDFRIMNEFVPALLDLSICSVYCIWAEMDYGISKDIMSGWQNYANTNIKWYKARGTHFYFEENEDETLEILIDIIKDIMR